MGSDVTAKALRHQIGGSIKLIGKKQLEMRDAKLDPKDVDLGVKTGRGQTAVFYSLLLHSTTHFICNCILMQRVDIILIVSSRDGTYHGQ